ncbi:iron ABC transporter permease [Ferrovibrio terrae]|uniref:Iron ABC transporter permease n=1 Tax=Ferrovibrio terrae TaxID=2594003 RepID=A0A516H673_9PROT|nr:iron ABC transporter permease [Ferrovibrio terrae]QDO99215.1 iron ABC transporter permease [Ferrovibrio terrae]
MNTIEAAAGTPLRLRFPLLLGLAVALLVAAMIAGLGLGAVRLSPGEVIATLFGQAVESRHETIILYLRLPRVLLAGLVGAALGVSGGVMQGLFRNPLADPSLIGVSAGATVAAASVIVLTGWIFPPSWQPVLLPLGAFGGGLLVIAMIYRVALVNGTTVVPMLLLAGIAFNAIALSLTGFLVFIANDAQLRDISFWTFGSVGGARWQTVLMVAPCALAPFFALPWFARSLDALNLGEREAGHLGFRVEWVKRLACLCTALAVGGAVAVSGTVGFVGLLVPHVVRMIAGPMHGRLLPLSAILGAALLIGADLVARTIVAPAELPLGLLTCLIGAPVFLSLLWRARAGFSA